MCISPASCHTHFRSGPVASWLASAWRCSWHGLPCLHFHCALYYHRLKRSKGAFAQSHFFPTLSPLLTLIWPVLVLDQPSVPGRSRQSHIHLAVDRTIRFGDVIYPSIFLGGRSLVCW